MGEAMYYIKARFSKELTRDQEEQLTNFIVEGQAAHDWWQDHRHCPDAGAFWKRFAEKFPHVTVYLGDLVGGDCNNALAGVLDFGCEDDLEALEFDYLEFRYHCECWHFATWDRFTEYLKTRFAATSASWLSDEDMDPFDAL